MLNIIVIGGGIAAVSFINELGQSGILRGDRYRLVWISASRAIKNIVNVRKIGRCLETFQVETCDMDPRSLEGGQEFILGKVLKVGSNKLSGINLESGAPFVLDFFRLCICTGAEPTLPFTDSVPITNVKLSSQITNFEPDAYCRNRIITLRDTLSVRHLQKLVADSTNVLIVGGGGIALELAYVLPINIIWAFRADYPGNIYFSDAVSKFLAPELLQTCRVESNNTSFSDSPSADRNICGPAVGPRWFSQLMSQTQAKAETGKAKKKLELIANAVVTSIKKNSDSTLCVALSNGRQVIVDFVIYALGAAPDLTWLSDAPIRLAIDANEPQNSGIIVDENMQTSNPSIYAAGDVCRCQWDFPALWKQMRLWNQAKAMGIQAAKSIASELQAVAYLRDFSFELFTHVTEFFGFKVVLLGQHDTSQLDESSIELLVRCTPGVEFVQVIIGKSSGRILGCTLIGETDLEEVFENLILDQIDVSKMKDVLLDTNFDIEDFYD